MAKIAVVVMEAQGHINPTLAVAEELTRRGHEVTYWVTEPYRETVEAAGVHFRAFDSLMSKRERPAKLDPSMTLRILPKMLLGEALHILPQLEAGFAADRLDLVLYDNMSVGGRVIAAALKIPAVALFTSYAGNDTFNIMRRLGALPPDSQAEYDALMGEICAKYKIEPIAFAEIFSHAESLNLVFMPRAWQPHEESFDQRYVFVGPCLGTRSQHEHLAPEIYDRGPVLFISLGTAFNQHPEFYRECFRAFGNTPWNVILSIGKKTDLSSLGEIPANFTVRASVPQLEVLEHTRVFITHGGMNSTMEALGLGLPLIAIPQMHEQAVTAQRIEELGVGVRLEMDHVDAAHLREAVAKVAEDPEMRGRAAGIREALRAAGGPSRAGDAVDSLIRQVVRRSRELEAT